MRKKEEVECILRDELPSPASSSSSSVTSCSGMGGGANGEISRDKMKTLLTKAVTYFAYACPHTYTHTLHTPTHSHTHTPTHSHTTHTHTHTHTFLLLFRIQFMRRGDSTLKPGGETLCVPSKEELQVVVDLVNSLVVGQHHHDVVR